MHPDFFKGIYVGEFAKLRDCLEANSMAYTWTPSAKTRIVLMHSAEDDYIPVEGADLLYQVYKSKGVDITYRRIKGGHKQAAKECVLSLLLYLLLK